MGRHLAAIGILVVPEGSAVDGGAEVKRGRRRLEFELNGSRSGFVTEKECRWWLDGRPPWS